MNVTINPISDLIFMFPDMINDINHAFYDYCHWFFDIYQLN